MTLFNLFGTSHRLFDLDFVGINLSNFEEKTSNDGGGRLLQTPIKNEEALQN